VASNSRTDAAAGGALKRWVATLSPSPDLSSTRTLALAALAVSVGVWFSLCWHAKTLNGLGDTDDAMRLVLVRDLMAGRGWYDQVIHRLAPPQGVYLHWSRLLDGGIAGLIGVLRLFVSRSEAELAARYLWPLVWVFPGVVAALALARNLGARAAVFLTAPLMVLDMQLYRQFTPGRIDHHNIQIVMTVVALACATARNQRTLWAVAGGASAALGLAIGLEALPLQALIGASYGLAFIRDPEAGQPAAAYGLALAAAGVTFFAIQTAPWRWGLSFCDALALNLVAALVVAGAGLAATGAIARRTPMWGRIAMLGLVGSAAGAAYLAFDPQCIRGPFAAMDPAVRPFWFDRVQEVQPLPIMLGLERAPAVMAICMMVLSLGAGAYLAVRNRCAASTSALLIGGCLVVACITAYFAWRMQDYVFWIGMPALGAAFSYIALHRLRDLMVPSFAAAILLAPASIGNMADAAVQATSRRSTPQAAGPGLRCFAVRGYRALAALPPGLVLASQDLAPFMLALTPQFAIAAPYHRMSQQILAVHEALDAPPAQAEARVRALRADYIVDCPPYPLMVGPKSFASTLRKGVIPAWLEPLSGPKDVLKIYRVRPEPPGGA